MCSFLCGIVSLALGLIVSLDEKREVYFFLKLETQKQEFKACIPFVMRKLVGLQNNISAFKLFHDIKYIYLNSFSLK